MPVVVTNKWEKGIREKVYASGILSLGEWSYLVGLFNLANDEWGPVEVERIETENKLLRAALEDAHALIPNDLVGPWAAAHRLVVKP